MIPRVAELLRTCGIVPDIGPNTKLSAIKMRNTAWLGGSLVALLFVDDGPTPRYVLRVPRDPTRTERLTANYAALEALAAIPALRGTVPYPIFKGEVDGALATLETYLDGSSVAMEMSVADRTGDEARFAELLTRACDWLWTLHSATWSEPLPAFFENCAADVELLDQRGFLDAGEVNALRAHLTSLRARPLPFARCHGDYNPNNLLLPSTPQPLGVVDWEYSAPGCALFDLFQLVTIAYLFPATTPTARCSRLDTLWAPRTTLGLVFNTALGRYAEHLPVCLSDLRPLFAAYFAHMAADHHRIFGDQPEPMRAFWHDLLQHEIACPE